MTLSMGILIPPFIKAIMGMVTTPIGLIVYYSPISQCSMETPVAIPYLALKDSFFSKVSTKLANLPILGRVNMEELNKKTLKDRRLREV